MRIKKFNELLASDDFDDKKDDFFTNSKKIIQRDILGTYPENVTIDVEIYYGESGFIRNENLNNRVGIFIWKLIDSKFNLDFIKKNSKYVGSSNIIDPKVFKKVSKYLLNLGFIINDSLSNKKCKRYIFKIETSLKDLKNKANEWN